MLSFGKKVVVFLFLISALLILCGVGMIFPEDAYWLKWLQPLFSKKIANIDYGLDKKLNFFPSRDYKTATLRADEPGFKEILEIIRRHDSFAPQKVVQITQRKDFTKKFYWAEKEEIGVIFLDKIESATTQNDVYPVDLAPVVFGWIAKEKGRILSAMLFYLLSLGALFGISAWFLREEIRKREQKYNISNGSIKYKPKGKDQTLYKCLVLMPIGEKNTPEYLNNMKVFDEIIKPCVENSGYNIHCYHLDLLAESGDIAKQGIQALKDDPIVIADLRRRNPAVSYELGIRHTLFKRSILICSDQTDHFFYTSRYRAIEYKLDGSSNQEFYNKLASFIDEILSNPEKSDNPVSDILRGITSMEGIKENIELNKTNVAAADNEVDFHRLVAAGIQYENVGRHDLAIDCFEDALKIKPDDISLHNQLCIIYGERIGDKKSKAKAINHCNEILRIDKNNVLGKFNLAVYTNHLNGAQNSLPIYLEAETLIRMQGLLGFEIDGKVNLFIGHDYRYAGNLPEAEKRYNKAIAIFKKLVEQGDKSSAFWLSDAKSNLENLLKSKQ